jgi:hypothetical protein
MHALTVASILLLIAGSLVLAGGLFLYWQTNPVSIWATALVIIGMLFLLGSIIMLCVSLQYNTEFLYERLRTNTYY